MQSVNTTFYVPLSHSLEGDERWFLVHTHPRGELRAQLHLAGQGFHTYLPQFSKTIRHARQLRTVRAPLFPRYLFVALDLGRDPWLSVRSTFGVSSLFTSNGQPVPVPKGVVEAILQQVGSDGVLLNDNLKKGQRVRLLTGPFADVVGILAELDDRGRVKVLLEMMGGAVSVDVHRSSLLPVA